MRFQLFLVVNTLLLLLDLTSAIPLRRRAGSRPFTVLTSSNITTLNNLPIAAHSGYFWIGIPARYGCFPATYCTNATIFNQPSGATGPYVPNNLTMYTQTEVQYAYVKADGRFAYTFSEETTPGDQISESDISRGFATVTDYMIDNTGGTATLAYTGAFRSGGMYMFQLILAAWV